MSKEQPPGTEKNEENELEKIEIQLFLEGIYRYYGYDFRNYSYSSLRRRIWHIIRTEKLATISALQEKVFHEPLFMEKLLADFSINVTEMFRNPEFFKAFRTIVVPELRKLPNIKIWHAGCSTGEEVYSVAILLHEEGLSNKVRIYATDINENVLNKANKGTFHLNKMKQYTQNYLQAGGTKGFSEYYVVKNNDVVFYPFLAQNVVFAQHNLVTDGSFNEFHVIICRNVLIYFDQVLQHRVHDLFYQSLSLRGFLGLGNREGIAFSSHAHCYQELKKAEKIFRKVK